MPAPRRHESGVVLDFGKPAFERPVPGRGSTTSIELARGTSSYHPDVPSTYETAVR